MAGRAGRLERTGPRREPGPPETLCGLQAASADPKPSPSYTVVAAVPRSPVAAGMSSGLSTLLLNAIIANGRGKLRMIPPPAGVSLKDVTISGAGTSAGAAPASPLIGAPVAAAPAMPVSAPAVAVAGRPGTSTRPSWRDTAGRFPI